MFILTNIFFANYIFSTSCVYVIHTFHIKSTTKPAINCKPVSPDE